MIQNLKLAIGEFVWGSMKSELKDVISYNVEKISKGLFCKTTRAASGNK